MIFDIILEKTLDILEGIRYIKYVDDYGLNKKTKIYTEVTNEKFVEFIQTAVDNRVTIGGIYTIDDSNFILFDRDQTDHTDIIGELELCDIEQISFYIIPRKYEDPNGWYFSTSDWSSTTRPYIGLAGLINNTRIKEIILAAEEIGYKYCPDKDPR